ncbi:hypothetical protein TTHERM_00418650 (macronuclear) [Tetrahymena thermophila SB210]|uniref:Uncharacterized protein n=1 Tax=Tetrahymena thermophila (strain SB210) TaxID=312017 RepID=Q22NT6_TETTS|nr:hypothetical protein TTHERM_00418650 [Tetrahymena thermophila SB210]EAR87075.2 hypothetical protein TTHERM_00418650 [Tetrahymena thermophila SB210]|eukprot:XP_001007320.2 hypothetical protein TTHERM_00418650 [Tetrahymena thermophila SB210]
MNSQAYLLLINQQLEKQYNMSSSYISNKETQKKFHSKEIKLRPKIDYQITNFKRFKLSSDLSYMIVNNNNNNKSIKPNKINANSIYINQNNENPTINLKIEEPSNNNTYQKSEPSAVSYDRQKVIQAHKKSNICGYKLHQQLQFYQYENLKSIFSQTFQFEIELLKNAEKCENLQLFMQFYDPSVILINSNQIQQFLAQQKQTNQSNLNDVQLQIAKPRFSFKNAIKIQFKEMREDESLKVKKALKNLFYLYLNGDYRGINESFSLREEEPENWEKAISNRYVSYKYKSKHINFDYCSKKADELSNDSPTRREKIENQFSFDIKNLDKEDKETEERDKKQVIYNKSKYVMQFLLKLLDLDHLEYLKVPEGFQNKIQSIKESIKETSKRNKLSQSQFYNHTHFDCLFLQITEANDHYVHSSEELLKMHCTVFDVADLVDSFTINTVNFYKELVTQIIIEQIHLIRSQIIPQLAVHTLSFKSSSKLKYFERICDSIEKLKEGQIISKF